MFARRFKIFLKDETELSAKLVTVSEKYDLALLRLEGYKTPFLNEGKPESLIQGSKVFAIGLFGLGEMDYEEKWEYKKYLEEHVDEEKRDLLKIQLEGGLKDAVTSGVVTRVKNDFIITDSHIYGGYSGGPLVDENGHVVGVNTWTFHQTIEQHTGFSIAISMDVVKKEFKSFLLKED